MIKPNLNSLNTTVSDTKKASESEICWREFLLSVAYFTNDCSYKIKEDEISDITKSLYNWTTRRNSKKCFSKNIDTGNYDEVEVKVGDIFLADLGINYKPECSYVHPVIIIEKVEEYVVVLPTSTNENKILNAYNFDTKTGKWYYIKVSESDGFDSTCVVMLNNLKTISKGRLIKHEGHLTEDIRKENSLYSNIKSLLYKHYFPRQYTKFKNTMSENEQLKEKIKNLEEELEIVKKDLL